jgi:2-isopropylmalate synthase
VSDLAGKASIAMKAEEMGVELDGPAATTLTEELKNREAQGFVYEAADASLELLMREAGGWRQDFFRLEGYRVTTYHRNALRGGAPIDSGESMVDTEATVKVWVGDDRLVSIGEGNGPVNALDHALRTALNGRYPALERIHLIDYRVRVLDSSSTTSAVVRVLVDSTDGDNTWTTIGVDSNIIEASWQALVDSLVYGLLHAVG